MLSEFDTATAVARGMALLSSARVPDVATSGPEANAYVLRDASGQLLCEVPLESLRGWIPSGPLGHVFSLEEVIGAPTGERWEYCFVRVELEEDQAAARLTNVLINGRSIASSDAAGQNSFESFHDLLNLIGDRGWELVNTVLRNLDEHGLGRAYSLIFKRHRSPSHG
jgi:hypothetical protein